MKRLLLTSLFVFFLWSPAYGAHSFESTCDGLKARISGADCYFNTNGLGVFYFPSGGPGIGGTVAYTPEDLPNMQGVFDSWGVGCLLTDNCPAVIEPPPPPPPPGGIVDAPHVGPGRRAVNLFVNGHRKPNVVYRNVGTKDRWVSIEVLGVVGARANAVLAIGSCDAIWFFWDHLDVITHTTSDPNGSLQTWWLPGECLEARMPADQANPASIPGQWGELELP